MHQERVVAKQPLYAIGFTFTGSLVIMIPLTPRHLPPKRNDFSMNLIQVLKRCEVFVGLGDRDLEMVASLSSWRRSTYDTGEFIFYENTKAEDFYILERGEVSLMITSYKKETGEVTQIPVDNITTGDVFGWSAIVAPHSRAMSAISTKPSSVFAVHGTELTKLMDTHHSLGYEVMKGLVRVMGTRLRNLPDKLAGRRKLPPGRQRRPR